MTTTPELTDAEIQSQLAGESVRGPRNFRGRTLATLTRGLRAVFQKVIEPADDGAIFDLSLLHILAEAHGATPDAQLTQRQALLVATDDIAAFRARMSLALDAASEEEIAEARRLTNEILGIIEKAEVSLVEKKSGPASAAPSPMKKPSRSGSSRKKPASDPNTSAGN